MATMVTVDYKYFPTKRFRVEAKIALILNFLKKESHVVSVCFTDDKTIRQYNRRYRNRDATTDVLSFSQHEGDAFPNPTLLGDVLISVDTARRNARRLRLPVEGEIDALLIHGILHLLGYDHESTEDARKRMQMLEQQLIKKISRYAHKQLALLART